MHAVGSNSTSGGDSDLFPDAGMVSRRQTRHSGGGGAAAAVAVAAAASGGSPVRHSVSRLVRELHGSPAVAGGSLAAFLPRVSDAGSLAGLLDVGDMLTDDALRRLLSSREDDFGTSTSDATSTRAHRDHVGSRRASAHSFGAPSPINLNPKVLQRLGTRPPSVAAVGGAVRTADSPLVQALLAASLGGTTSSSNASPGRRAKRRRDEGTTLAAGGATPEGYNAWDACASSAGRAGASAAPRRSRQSRKRGRRGNAAGSSAGSRSGEGAASGASQRQGKASGRGGSGVQKQQVVLNDQGVVVLKMSPGSSSSSSGSGAFIGVQRHKLSPKDVQQHVRAVDSALAAKYPLGIIPFPSLTDHALDLGTWCTNRATREAIQRGNTARAAAERRVQLAKFKLFKADPMTCHDARRILQGDLTSHLPLQSLMVAIDTLVGIRQAAPARQPASQRSYTLGGSGSSKASTPTAAAASGKH